MSAGSEVDSLQPLFIKLAQRTGSNQVSWNKEGEDAVVRFAFGELRLGKSEGSGAYRVKITNESGLVILHAEVSPRNSMFGAVEQLYEAANRAILSSLVERMGEALEHEPFVGLIVSPFTTSAALPPRPSIEQASEFFKLIKGRWSLDFERGTEEVDIDENGVMCVLKKRIGGTLRGMPKYRLELLECTPGFQHVEIAKVELNGRIRQIESLRVTPTEMVGVAKHDGHRLKYVRG